jgi:signal transduction histidine kinase
MADTSIADEIYLNKKKSLAKETLTMLSSWSAHVRNNLALTGWVILGLALITLLATILARFPGWFGPVFFGPKADILITNAENVAGQAVGIKTTKTLFMITIMDAGNLLSTVLPVLVTLFLYSVMSATGSTRKPSRLASRAFFSWLAVSLTLLAIGIMIIMVASPGASSPFQYCLLFYAFTAYARVALSKKQSWLVEGVVLVIVLCVLATIHPQKQFLAPPPGAMDAIPGGPQKMNYSFDDGNQLMLRIPLLGVQVGWTLQWFEAIVWAIGLLCLHIFTGIGVHERAARQRSELLIKELTQAQEQLRAYALRAEELATMRERTRVAREVHDTLAQGLAAIKMHLETSSKVFPETPAMAQKHLERARELAGEYLQETRTSILNLRTGVLRGRTLPVALSELVAGWRPAAGTHGATFCVSGSEREDAVFWQTLAPAIELSCYRIVQEALSNATRHGQAQHIDVELSMEKDELCLTITDDGVGFDPTTLVPRQTGGFGIIGMHERLKQLGGRLEIISAPATGTQVVAMIPLVSAHHDELIRSTVG